MTESIITYRSMTKTNASILLGILGCVSIGYVLADLVLPLATWDWLIIFGVFIILPLMITIFGYGVGWYGKKNALHYSEPDWTYAPVQMTIDDIKKVDKENTSKNWRMVANSNYWIFFIPIVLMLFMAALPVYLIIESPSLAPLDVLMYSMSLALTFAVASVGALRATSNDASDDFTILLVRETIRLAKVQENIPGLSHIRVVLDKAEQDGFSVYEAPRVVCRIKGLERDGYIESWSEELGSVNRVLCRLYKSDDHPEVLWWWFPEDRHFRKFVDEDKTGYYVKYPIHYKTGDPGVKDPDQVIESAVAIMILEWFHSRGESEELSQILEELNVDRS
ncbi:MAG: hypothetical protein ACXAAK_13875 [Candidatus Thorarchaeota archaeon]|jgi:hypothetical protein